MKKGKILIVFTLLLSSLVSCKMAEGGDESEKTVAAEDFSMSRKEINPTRYADLPLAAEAAGFDFYSLQEFSNGYKFSSFSASDKQVKLTYKHANGVYAVTLSACQTEEPKHSVRYEWTKEIEGIPVSLDTYITRFVPEEYEKTDADIELEESGKGALAVDGVTVGDSYHYTLYFVRDGIYYELWGAIDRYLPLEEFEGMVAEFIRSAELQRRGNV